MRHTTGFGLTALMLAAAAVWMLPAATAPGDDRAAAPAPPAAKAAAPLQPPTQDWRSDPACQLVFFAVLEGLYADGVPDEVVDLIVPPAEKNAKTGEAKDGDSSVKQCFVFRCPLCHAAYEAFVLYQRRQGFNGSGEAKSTFGKDFDRNIIEQLKSDKPATRVYAMGRMIRPWIKKRMDLMRMGETEQKALLDKLLKYAADGDALFQKYRGQRWSVYSEWMFYGGCQACEAAKEVAKEIREKGGAKAR